MVHPVQLVNQVITELEVIMLTLALNARQVIIALMELIELLAVANGQAQVLQLAT